jgi:glutamate N-acetyltransferase/amino-acid N-acetyltransferase
VIIQGFKYSAVAAGIRKKDRLDLGLIFSEKPAVAAGVFTTNRVKAAPVLLGMERMEQGRVQAVLVNSGVANACTGAPGMQAAQACSGLAAAALHIDENLVQISSTGVIGEQLPVEKVAAAMDDLVAGLTPAGSDKVAEAIMTTDTVPKTAERTCSIDGNEVKIFGIAKGAGMIMPDTVDGDTSTNDTVLILANSASGSPEIDTLGTDESIIFEAALTDLLKDLALQIVADGEGGTKIVTVRVINAADEKDAEQAARTIANSSLVKTAFFGEDANWGRIIAALGRSGVAFEQDSVDISFDDVLLVQDGQALGVAAEAKATEVLKHKTFTITVDLKNGPAAGEIYTCDLSIDYIKINADYRS